MRSEEETERVTAMHAWMKSLSALLERLGSTEQQRLIENFGVVRAIASGALTNDDVVQGVLRVNGWSERGSQPCSFGQATHLWLELVALSGKTSLRGFRRLARSMYLVEAVAYGMFDDATFMRRCKRRVEVPVLTGAQRVRNAKERGVQMGDEALERLFEAHSGTKNGVIDPRLRAALFTTANVRCGDLGHIDDLFGAFDHRPPSISEVLAFVNDVHPGDGEFRDLGWEFETLTVLAADAELLLAGIVLEMTVRQKGQWLVRRMPRVPEDLRALLGGLGDNRYLLGVQRIPEGSRY